MIDKSLAELMADAARQLEESATEEKLLALAADVAAREIDPCDGAAISIVHRGGGVDTQAATSVEARRSDELQYEVGEGPCLSAIWQSRTVESPDLRADDRWPEWGRRMSVETAFRSMVAFQLFTHADNLGALNLYSERPQAFGPAAVDHGHALAAHLSVALASARHIDQLDAAMAARSTIGMAIGIVMERYGLTSDKAFALLTRVSSTTNRKIRDIAADLVAGGSLPEG